MKRHTTILSLISCILFSFVSHIDAAQSAVATKTVRLPARVLQRCAEYLHQKETSCSELMARHEQYYAEQQKSSEPVDGCPETGALVINLGTSCYLTILKTSQLVCSACARALGAQP